MQLLLLDLVVYLYQSGYWKGTFFLAGWRGSQFIP